MLPVSIRWYQLRPDEQDALVAEKIMNGSMAPYSKSLEAMLRVLERFGEVAIYQLASRQKGAYRVVIEEQQAGTATAHMLKDALYIAALRIQGFEVDEEL